MGCVYSAMLTFAIGAGAVLDAFEKGLGVLGLNRPVGWGSYIITFVFWVGIGHAGTLISAILFLFRQKWRTGINRSAEAMTIFAVMTAFVPGYSYGSSLACDCLVVSLSQSKTTLAKL